MDAYGAPPGAPSPPEAAVEIKIDIIGVARDPHTLRVGNKLSDLHSAGTVPDGAGGGRNLRISTGSGSRIFVRDCDTNEPLVSGNGWSNTMQALADHYQLKVVVDRDWGVVGGKSGKVLGTWLPAAARRAAAPALGGILPAPKPACGAPAMRAVLDAPLARELKAGDLLHITDGEFAPVLAVAVTEDRQRVVVTWGDQHRAHKLFRTYNEVVLTADPATIRLTKAQAELLRAVAHEHRPVYYRPSNAGWAPRHAIRAAMFELARGGKTSNRTPAGNALDVYGLIAYKPESHCSVELTEPGRRWLAAHPN